MSITVFGSVNVDLTAYVKMLPKPGVTSHPSSSATGLGGKGATQSVAAQRLSGTPVRLAAAVGSDAFGARATDFRVSLIAITTNILANEEFTIRKGE